MKSESFMFYSSYKVSFTELSDFTAGDELVINAYESRLHIDEGLMEAEAVQPFKEWVLSNCLRFAASEL